MSIWDHLPAPPPTKAGDRQGRACSSILLASSTPKQTTSKTQKNKVERLISSTKTNSELKKIAKVQLNKTPQNRIATISDTSDSEDEFQTGRSRLLLKARATDKRKLSESPCRSTKKLKPVLECRDVSNFTPTQGMTESSKPPNMRHFDSTEISSSLLSTTCGIGLQSAMKNHNEEIPNGVSGSPQVTSNSFLEENQTKDKDIQAFLNNRFQERSTWRSLLRGLHKDVQQEIITRMESIGIVFLPPSKSQKNLGKRECWILEKEDEVERDSAIREIRLNQEANNMDARSSEGHLIMSNDGNNAADDDTHDSKQCSHELQNETSIWDHLENSDDNFEATDDLELRAEDNYDTYPDEQEADQGAAPISGISPDLWTTKKVKSEFSNPPIMRTNFIPVDISKLQNIHGIQPKGRMDADKLQIFSQRSDHCHNGVCLFCMDVRSNLRNHLEYHVNEEICSQEKKDVADALYCNMKTSCSRIAKRYAQNWVQDKNRWLSHMKGLSVENQNALFELAESAGIVFFPKNLSLTDDWGFDEKCRAL